MNGTWREHAAPIIARVIEEVGRDDEKKLRAALRAAYPYGPREHHPYKVWCDEVRIQLGKKRRPHQSRVSYFEKSSPGQQELF